MKYLIKVTIIFVAAFLANATESKAQTGPEVCKILYGYDVSGNRIKREYKCENTWLPSDPMPWNETAEIFSTLNPNPTTGVLTGTFTTPIGGEAGSALLTVSTMGGITVLQLEYTEIASSITFDISQQIPGNYLVTVHAFNKVETYVITKL